MSKYRYAVTLLLGTIALWGANESVADSDYRVVTIISSETLESTRMSAPDDRVSDQPVRHVESAQGNLGIGVVHRPVIEAGGPIRSIQHHKQSEVYRVMSGAGTLVTSRSMSDATPLAADGYTVANLTGTGERPLGVLLDRAHEGVGHDHAVVQIQRLAVGVAAGGPADLDELLDLGVRDRHVAGRRAAPQRALADGQRQ